MTELKSWRAREPSRCTSLSSRAGERRNNFESKDECTLHRKQQCGGEQAANIVMDGAKWGKERLKGLL